MLVGSLAPRAGAERRAIDLEHSRLLVTVYKSGLFSLFAHNHEIVAPIASGSVEMGASPSVQLQIDTAKLRLLDPELTADTRAEIQQTMLGSDVLDAARYPVIQFASRKIEKTGENSWRVEGDLTLHGQKHPVAFDVSEADGAYSGSVTILQSEFGIKPLRIAKGTVRVKDAVLIRLRIELRDSAATSAAANGGIQ